MAGLTIGVLPLVTPQDDDRIAIERPGSPPVNGGYDWAVIRGLYETEAAGQIATHEADAGDPHAAADYQTGAEVDATVAVHAALPTHLPAGGAEGQVLTKQSATDHDTDWADPGAKVIVSDTAPLTPEDGDLWFESDTGRLLVWYEDGTSDQWIEITAPSGGTTGGLEHETSRDTDADHADFNMVIGKVHHVDMSAPSLTGEVVATLPALFEVGQRSSVYVSGTSVTDGEELSVRSAAGDLVHGIDYSAADFSRLAVEGEFLEFEGTVANSEWRLYKDGRSMHSCELEKSDAQTISGGSAYVVIAHNNTVRSHGLIGNPAPAGATITIRRAGRYLCHFKIELTLMGAGFIVIQVPEVNAVQNSVPQDRLTAHSEAAIGWVYSVVLDLNAGDLVRQVLLHTDTVGRPVATYAHGRPRLTVTELPERT